MEYICVGTVLLLILYVIIVAYHKNLQRRRLLNLDRENLYALSGADFEKYLKVLFEGVGCRVEQVRYSHDLGTDLVVEQAGRRWSVQAKRYAPDRKVGRRAVSDAVAGKAAWKCEGAMVVTTALQFTRGAKRLAKANDCILIAAEELGNLIGVARGEDRPTGAVTRLLGGE